MTQKIQKINPKYEPLYTSDKKIILVTGGRGSAKSFEVSRFLQRLTFEKGHKMLYCRYTMDSASISIIPEFKEKIELEGTSKYFNVTKKEIINLGSGSEIWFRGIKTQSGNQTAKLKSIQGLTTFVVDEAEEWNSDEEFKKIMRSIRQPDVKNRIIIIMNSADATHWIWNMFFKNNYELREIDGHQIEFSTHPEVHHIHTTYLDNVQHLSDDFLRDARNTSSNNAKEYRHQFLGGWKIKPDGAIFTNWEEGQFNDSLPFIYGMDFGYVNDPTTLIKVSVDNKRKIIYAHELMYVKGLSTLEIHDELMRIGLNDSLIVADNSEPRLIDELCGEGHNMIPCTKGADSVRLGISKMCNYTIIVTTESNNLKTELNNYIWNNKKSNVPIDNHNHLIDALRYAVDELTQENDFFFG